MLLCDNKELLHIRFLPEQEQENNISSRQFLKQAEFINIDSVYMRARATGEFTRQELTKAGNVTELPKNFTDYHEEDDEPQNPSGGSGSQSGGGSDSGSTSGGSQSGNTSGDGQQTSYNLTITRSGSGTSTVKDDSENVITGQRSFAPGTNLNIEIVPAEGQVPTATINGSSIELTENDGTYTGSFQMPAQVSVLVLNSGSNSSGDDDPYNPIDTGN